MTRIRRTRAVSSLASLLAAAVLLSSTGCGFCFGPFGCSGSDCCVGSRCRSPEDCPAKTKTGLIESDLVTSPDPDQPTD